MGSCLFLLSLVIRIMHINGKRIVIEIADSNIDFNTQGDEHQNTADRQAESTDTDRVRKTQRFP